jgi:hypothetical protein
MVGLLSISKTIQRNLLAFSHCIAQKLKPCFPKIKIIKLNDDKNNRLVNEAFSGRSFIKFDYI